MSLNIESNFPICSINNCLEVYENSIFWVLDSLQSKKSFVLLDNSLPDFDFDFEVNNPNQKTIYFLAIDNCIFNDSSDHKKCDFAIFDNQTICFVEIKNQVSINPDTRKKQARSAREQLKETIVKFKEKIDFSDYKIEAIICQKNGSIKPAASTGMQSAGVEFQKEFNAKLLKGSSIIFN